jgi:membrane fusion protein, multidrug efflux system
MMPLKTASLTLAIGLLLTGCADEGAPKQAAGGMPPVQVEVVTPQTIQQQETLVLPGRLQAVRSAEVRARVEGIIERRLYKEGGEVKAGESLFQIDPKVLQANVQTAKASLMRAQADARISEQTSERLKALVPQKAASQQDLDTANANLARAKADIEAAKAALSRAEIDLGYAKVTAPISGRIGRALVTEGALVGKGSATPLAVIEQMDPIWVNFALSSNQYAQLRSAVDAQAGQAAGKIQLKVTDKETYAQLGKLLFTDPAVDATTGSVGLRAEFANAERRLLPGQFVSVVLPISGDKAFMTVPQKAVQASPQGQIVMTVTAESKVAPRPIKTGALVNGAWIVLSGLQGDEQIVVNGLQKARPGSTVTAVPAGSAAPAPAGGK